MREYFRDYYRFQKKHWKWSLFFGMLAGGIRAYSELNSNSTRRV